MYSKILNKLLTASDLIDDIKGIILSNIIVNIKDSKTNELLWSCHDGIYRRKLKGLKIEIDQDLNLTKVLKEILDRLKEK